MILVWEGIDSEEKLRNEIKGSIKAQRNGC